MSPCLLSLSLVVEEVAAFLGPEYTSTLHSPWHVCVGGGKGGAVGWGTKSGALKGLFLCPAFMHESHSIPDCRVQPCCAVQGRTGQNGMEALRPRRVLSVSSYAWALGRQTWPQGLSWCCLWSSTG